MKCVTELIEIYAAKTPARVAVRDLGSGWAADYALLCQLVDGRIQELAACGLALGDRVAWIGRNSAEMLVTLLACMRLGLMFTPLNWRLTEAELAVVVTDAAPEVLFYSAEFASLVRQATATHTVDPQLIQVAPLDREAPPQADWKAARAVDPESPCLLIYTSGTTGRPKGVLLSKSDLTSANHQLSERLRLGPDTVMRVDMPMFHGVGLLCALMPLCVGGVAVISPAFYPASFLRNLREAPERVTHAYLAPQMCQLLRAHPEFTRMERPIIRCIVTGGGHHSPAEVLQWLDEGVCLVRDYGLSEAATSATMPPDMAVIRRKPEATGLLRPDLEHRIVDAEGREAVRGELRLRGSSIFKQYWRQPDATAQMFDDAGWFKTGDLVEMDADGYLYIVGRLKDTIVSSGQNIDPCEVENVLLRDESLAAAAVVAAPDAVCGEAPVAFVVVRPGQTVDESRLWALCLANLAQFKIPRAFHVMDELPRTASGKVKKVSLRAIAAEHHAL